MISVFVMAIIIIIIIVVVVVVVVMEITFYFLFQSFLLTDDVKPLSPTEDEIDRFILSSPKSPLPIKTIDCTPRKTPPPIKQMVPTFTLPGAIEQEIPLEEFLAEHEPRVTKATKPTTRQSHEIVDQWCVTLLKQSIFICSYFLGGLLTSLQLNL